MVETNTTEDARAEMADAVAAAAAEVQALVEQNDQAIARLMADGARIEQSSITTLRFMTLLDVIFGDMTSLDRLAYERAVNERFAAQLDGVESQIRQAKLMAGTGTAPQAAGKLIIPGR